jgi:hypothetical protein
MATICAHLTAGVDVKPTLQTASPDVAVGANADAVIRIAISPRRVRVDQIDALTRCGVVDAQRDGRGECTRGRS